MKDYASTPDNLPVPLDDGATDHLVGMTLPSVMLDSTQGGTVDLSTLSGYVVVYCYPMTGQPGVPLPEGWDDIPGARGCTPQNMCYRDHHAEFQALGAQVFGLSVQSTACSRHATHQAFDLDCQGRQSGGGQIPHLPQQQRRFMGVGLAWQTNVMLGC